MSTFLPAINKCKCWNAKLAASCQSTGARVCLIVPTFSHSVTTRWHPKNFFTVWLYSCTKMVGETRL